MKILHFCKDRELLTVRSLYMTALGFEVTSVLGSKRAADLIESETAFDAVILCHTLDGMDKNRVATTIRNRDDEMLIIELYSVERAVTDGIRLDAVTEFQPFMMALSSTELSGESEIPDRPRDLNSTQTGCRAEPEDLTVQ